MKYFIVYLFLLCLPIFSFSQNKPLDDDSMNKKIILPIEIEMVDKRQPIIYNVPSQDLSLDYKAILVKPLSFQPNKKGEYNWLKIGAGDCNNRQVLTSLLLPIGANNLQCIAGYSSASVNKIQAHQHLLANVSYQYFSEKNDANLGAEITINNQNRYGLDNVNARSQNFNSFKIFGKWMPKDNATKRNNSIINGEVKYIKTNTSLAELNAKLNGNFIFKKGKKDLCINIIGQYNNMYDDSSSRDVSYIQPSVGYQASKENTDWKLGLSGIIGSSIFYPIPYLQLNHKLANKNIIHFNIQGQALQTSLHDALLQNPFAEYNINNFEIGRLYQASVGYTFAIKKSTTANVKIAYNDYQNAIQYNNELNLVSNLILVDFVDASSIQYQFGLLYHATQDWQIGFDAGLQSFIQNEISHIPTTDVNIYSHFQISQKLKWKLDYVFRNGIQVRTLVGIAITTKPNHDLHTELNYQLMKHINIYTQVNNILNQTNQRWYGYDSYQRNFVVGLQLH
jgi:hypothetical protein